MHSMNTLVCFVIDDALIVKILSGSMHRVRPRLAMQYCMETEKYLPCNLLLVWREQVTYFFHHY